MTQKLRGAKEKIINVVFVLIIIFLFIISVLFVIEY
jgi:hypothetical protein